MSLDYLVMSLALVMMMLRSARQFVGLRFLFSFQGLPPLELLKFLLHQVELGWPAQVS